MKAIYDVENHKFTDNEHMPSGAVGFISWRRLSTILGVFDNERVTHMKIEDDGITFRTESTS